eukprot:jgi/Mesvir1/12246/Mv00463-RA.1
MDGEQLKCVVVGDGGTGKTCILMSYTTNMFPRDYVPTVFDNFSSNVPYGDTIVNLGLWDTAGQAGYGRLRPLSYANAHVFLVVFDLTNQQSFENVSKEWIPELKRYSPDVPIVLVGNKTDLRDDPDNAFFKENPDAVRITAEQGKARADQIGALYVECSAKTTQGLKNVFESAIRVVRDPTTNGKKKQKEKACCSLM